MLKILQCNLNHCWSAQDLFEQNMIDLHSGLGIVSEPVRIPESVHWFGSVDGRSAIRWNPEILHNICILVKRGQHYVAIKRRFCYFVLFLLMCLLGNS